MIKNWDEEESAKDSKTWETIEGGENAMNYILNKYIGTQKDKKINPLKQTADEVLDLYTNTLLFHQFALDNYRVLIEYNKKENILDIVKIKDYED